MGKIDEHWCSVCKRTLSKEPSGVIAGATGQVQGS